MRGRPAGAGFRVPPDAIGNAPPVDWKRDFAAVWGEDQGGFDAVVGNPPYVNIRCLTRTRGAAFKRYLRAHYACARGAYDLYVLFLELAVRLLRPGGLCGMIVPNKIAGLAYAGPCRELLLEQTTILRIVDLTRWRVFPNAGVYPYVMIWQKHPPPPHHRIEVVEAAAEAELEADRARHAVVQATLSASTGFRLHGNLDVEVRVATCPLRTLADPAQRHHGIPQRRWPARWSRRLPIPLASNSPSSSAATLIGTASAGGAARFMKRIFVRPVLPAGSGQLTERKRRLFRGPKIVIAGMSRRIEAAWDPGGLALGVQVYAAADLREDRRYLLGLLNSKLFSFLFRLRFRAKQLAGGFLAMNKAQLGQLPVRIIGVDDPTAQKLRQELVEGVERLERLVRESDSPATSRGDESLRMETVDREIDQCVYRLYGLTAEEIAEVEAAFLPRSSAAKAGEVALACGQSRPYDGQ